MAEDNMKTVLNSLQETPEEIRRLTTGLRDAQLRWKPKKDHFSVLENIRHLRDIEMEGYATRLRRILNETRPFLPDIDGPKLASERDYNSQDFDTSLRDFVEARKQNVQALGNVSSEQFNREGVLEGLGVITLEKLVLLMREHDEEHLRELSELRRLLVDQPIE
jgi:hypothetical protein